MNALLHVGWSWYPSVIIGFSLWTLLYVLATRRIGSITPAQQIAFHSGTLVGLLALISPLDLLGDEYLFSAHMVQHLLLMFVTAPLWLIGMPRPLIERIIPHKLVRLLGLPTRPIVAYLTFVSVMGFWHIPSIFEAVQANESIHIFEHLTFIGAALIGWWPALGAGSVHLPRLTPPSRMLYLFLLAFPCTALAALLTFSRTPLYAFYVSAPHIFGLNALQDQRLGGLFMWLPTHLILLLALGVIFFRWFKDSSQKVERDPLESYL